VTSTLFQVFGSLARKADRKFRRLVREPARIGRTISSSATSVARA
jgi:hypothetical protein